MFCCCRYAIMDYFNIVCNFRVVRTQSPIGSCWDKISKTILLGPSLLSFMLIPCWGSTCCWEKNNQNWLIEGKIYNPVLYQNNQVLAFPWYTKNPILFFTAQETCIVELLGNFHWIHIVLRSTTWIQFRKVSHSSVFPSNKMHNTIGGVFCLMMMMNG